MPTRYHLQRISDGALVRLANAVLAINADASANFSIADGLKMSWKSGEVLRKEYADVFGAKSFLITAGAIEAHGAGFSLSFYRAQIYLQNPQYGHRWEASTANPFVDGIEIAGPAKGEKQLALLQIVNKFLSLSPPARVDGGTEPIVDQATSLLERLSDAAATVVEHTAERQRDLDRYKDELEINAAARISSLEAELAEKQRVALAALEEREKDVQTRLSQLDDRENTHVRRELQQSMAAMSTDALDKPPLQSSQKSFALTEIVAISFSVILILLALIQSVSLSYNTPSRDLLLFGEARVIVLGLGAAALIWYALRLSAARHRQVSRWENELHRFRLDTERASFLIEGDLEARKLSQHGLPEVMLDRFSRGLFAGGPADISSDSDDIGSTLGHLLGRAAAVKLGTDGVSVEVDKAGVKRARRGVERERSSDE